MRAARQRWPLQLSVFSCDVFFLERYPTGPLKISRAPFRCLFGPKIFNPAGGCLRLAWAPKILESAADQHLFGSSEPKNRFFCWSQSGISERYGFEGFPLVGLWRCGCNKWSAHVDKENFWYTKEHIEVACLGKAERCESSDVFQRDVFRFCQQTPASHADSFMKEMRYGNRKLRVVSRPQHLPCSSLESLAKLWAIPSDCDIKPCLISKPQRGPKRPNTSISEICLRLRAKAIS